MKGNRTMTETLERTNLERLQQVVSQATDDRFQTSFAAEEWASIKEDFESKGAKIIMLPEITWYNTLVEQRRTIKNMPVCAIYEGSDRPMAIASITKQEHDEEEGWMEAEYVFNPFYAHININDNKESYTLTINDKLHYDIEYYHICSPITQWHFYNVAEEALVPLLVGQLAGQNTGSSFQTITSVRNGYKDCAIGRVGTTFIKKNAPIIQLLLRKSSATLRSMSPSDIKAALSNIRLPQSENECMVKYTHDDYYTVYDLSTLDTLPNALLAQKARSISSYYPIITYQQIKEINDMLPKVEVDVSCFGLGSAGSAILDQIGRSTYFKTYMLTDFDKVELKNLNNQWYLKSHIRSYKVDGARTLLNSVHPTNSDDLTILQHTYKFQDVALDIYDNKYVIAGFDSMTARKEFFDNVKSGKIKTKYLIDTRYDDLNASIFFVNVENKEEMDYYENVLNRDLEYFNAKEAEKYIKTEEEFIQYIREANTFVSNCTNKAQELYNLVSAHKDLTTTENILSYLRLGHCTEAMAYVLCIDRDPDEHGCESDSCVALWKRIWEDHKDVFTKALVNPHKVHNEESSCVRQNYIDIYKYTASFVFAAIREIESGNDKPFTHVDTTTHILPSSMVLKK